jgi:hypothetical protein
MSDVILLSGGVGEDISFEVELFSLIHPKIILIDPTTRSRKHVEEVHLNRGKSKSISYSNEGLQPIESYDLSKLEKNQFIFSNMALWKDNEGVALTPPSNEAHVSFRLPGRNECKEQTELFPSTTIKEVLEEFLSEENADIGHLVVKLDIEGSELEVLSNMLATSIFPNQLLVEFDVVRYADYKKMVELLFLIIRLRFFGYFPIKIVDYCVTFYRIHHQALNSERRSN